MKKILPIVLVAVIIILGVIFVPKLVHECDACGETFVGTGYEPNKLYELINDEAEVICEACAEEQYSLSTAFGDTLEEHKIDLF